MVLVLLKRVESNFLRSRRMVSRKYSILFRSGAAIFPTPRRWGCPVLIVSETFLCLLMLWRAVSCAFTALMPKTNSIRKNIYFKEPDLLSVIQFCNPGLRGLLQTRMPDCRMITLAQGKIDDYKNQNGSKTTASKFFGGITCEDRS